MGTTYAEQAEGPHVKGFPYIRWTIIALFVGAMVINYLTRSILGVAAPAIMAEQHISSEQYSWITGAFQFGIMFQPVAGYLLDLIGLKIGSPCSSRSGRASPSGMASPMAGWALPGFAARWGWSRDRRSPRA